MNTSFTNQTPKMDQGGVAETSRPRLPQGPDAQTVCKHMKLPSEPSFRTIPKPNTHLLDTIQAIRASVGDGLNDDELTRLLQRLTTLPTEAGFSFLSFSDDFMTLSVPPQDLASWYPDKGWIAPEKEGLARAIAKKFELSLYEPVDVAATGWLAQAESTAIHHHLEFCNHWQTVIVAHPRYLKVRQFGESPSHRYVWEVHCPLQFGPDLLQDLSALYQT
jgi:hypothetical protein